MNFDGIINIVDNWRRVISERHSNFSSMLDDLSIQALLKEHSDSVKAFDKSNAFTLFEVISSLYYRENFHSDLLAFFLDPNANHGYGVIGLELFVEMINKKTNLGIKASNYESAVVIREEGRIDILIKDDYTKHAIIVENKMNNAGDMDRQIPRYCDILDGQGFCIDAAIYLPMTRFKTPDTSSWRREDYRWQEKIVIIPAVSDNKSVSLINDWLDVLSHQDINEDVASSIRQYCYLITKLSNQDMDKISFDKLYDYLMANDNLDTANSFVSMMNDLPKYLAQRIFDLYSDRCFPFSKVWIYKEADAVFEQCMIDGLYCKMDVWCDTRNFRIQFWAPTDRDVSIVDSYGSFKDFLKTKGVNLFDNYDVSDKTTLITCIPITTPINTFIEPILDQLRSACQ